MEDRTLARTRSQWPFFSKGGVGQEVEEEKKYQKDRQGQPVTRIRRKGDGDAIEVGETQQHRNRMSPRPAVQAAEVRRKGMNAGYSGRT